MKKSDPRRVRPHRSYDVAELSHCLGIHENTVGRWHWEGLAQLDEKRPPLYHGTDVRSFLTERNARRKRPCTVGTLYCLKCRAPRPPAMRMADYVANGIGVGTLKAICRVCATIMSRRVRWEAVSQILPDCEVQVRSVGHH